MSGRVTAFAALIPATIMAMAGFGIAQEIHLKTRNIQAGNPASGSAGVTPGLAPVTSSDVHQLVQFDHSPSVEDIDALLAQGAQVVSVVPDNAVVVSAPGVAMPVNPGIRIVSRIDAADKISPALGSVQPFTVVVVFHADVGIDEQNAVALAENVTLQRPAALLSTDAIAQDVYSGLAAVPRTMRWLTSCPPRPNYRRRAIIGCAGMLTPPVPLPSTRKWSTAGTWIRTAGGARVLSRTLTTTVPRARCAARSRGPWQYGQSMPTSTSHRTSRPGLPRSIDILFARYAHGDAYPSTVPAGLSLIRFIPRPQSGAARRRHAPERRRKLACRRRIEFTASRFMRRGMPSGCRIRITRAMRCTRITAGE